MNKMVVTYMQRKVRSRNKSIDKYVKVYIRIINVIFTTNNIRVNFSNFEEKYNF